MFEITLKNGSVIEVTDVHLGSSTVAFRWIDGVYGGACSFPCELTSMDNIPGQIEAAANKELVSDETA